MTELRRLRTDDLEDFDDREPGDGLELDGLVESLLASDDDDEDEEL